MNPKILNFSTILIFIALFGWTKVGYAALPPQQKESLKEISKSINSKNIQNKSVEVKDPKYSIKIKSKEKKSTKKPKVSKSYNYLYKKPTNRKKLRPRYSQVDRRPFFDLPVTYNAKVRKWIKFFQGNGRKWFKKWMERSYRYLPIMQSYLKTNGLPMDLAYVAMIESGFSPYATSVADAVGYWQFIEPTGKRYGLKINWWLDERRDFMKSTQAAASYLGDLYKMFNSWYLTASAYNMGEGRMRSLIKRYKTRDFWKLAKQKRFPKETRNYIPKLIAAILISKAPKLYGFYNITPLDPYEYEYIYVPGGIDLINLAEYIKFDSKQLRRMNPELIKGFIPSFVENHRIRIPKGATKKVSTYIRSQIE